MTLKNLSWIRARGNALQVSMAVLLVAGAASCTKAPEAARYTVEEYRANKALREAKVKACANDPGTLGQTPDCVNALRAASLEGIGSLRKSAPIGLDPTRNPFGKSVKPPSDSGTGGSASKTPPKE